MVGAGILLRGIAAVFTITVAYPDEHQQFLEQAQSLAFGGPAVQFWDQERGVRNLLYPYVLAGLLFIVEAIGIVDPFAQVACLRFILSTTILLLFVWFARRDQARGHVVRAFGLVFLASITTSVVYINVRVLSENAMMIPLLLGLLCLERRPAMAGWWWGVMFAVRFQAGFLILGFFLVALNQDFFSRFAKSTTLWRMRTFRMGLGFLFSFCLFVGLLDRLTLGGWFHSPLEYYQAQIVEGVAANFGVSPWYTYFLWLGAAFLGTSVLCALFFALGAIKDWQLALVCTLFLIGHSLVGHKEFRFLWCALPLGLILTSRGMEAAWNWWGTRPRRELAASLVLASFVLGSLICLSILKWRQDAHRSSAQALAVVGKQPNATGVAMCGLPSWQSGNYFFLRRSIPLVFIDREAISSKVPALEANINYLILPAEEPMPLPQETLHQVADFGFLRVYEIRRHK
jgi:hypothetical protein